LGLASYKGSPELALQRCQAALAAAGIELQLDPALRELACRYDSGTARKPDHDVADAFVALVTALLYAEGRCRPLLAPDARHPEPLLRQTEGAIWVPAAPKRAALPPGRAGRGAATSRTGGCTPG
jgi:hypothetical protein